LSDLWLVFIAGLLASFHCVGMCGPIVLAYSLSGGGSTKAGPAGIGLWGLHLAYNGGRFVSYALIGAVAGLLGMVFSWIQVVGEYVSLVGGVLMILAGLALLGLLPMPRAFAAGAAGRGLRTIHGALLQSRTLGSKLLLGLLTPLLPCGILWAMVVKAAATENTVQGALTMGLFALGMAPALVLVGGVSSLVSVRVRKNAERLAAVTVILMGVFLVLRGLHVPYLSWMGGGAHGGIEGASCCGS